MQKIYELIDDPTSDKNYAVRVLNGDYIGVIFRFDTIKINPLYDIAKVKYSYTIIEDRHNSIFDTVKFENFTSEILHDIISNTTKNMETDFGSSTANSKKSSIFSKLLQTGYTIFENRIFRK